jgi:hypothetical protein
VLLLLLLPRLSNPELFSTRIAVINTTPGHFVT